MSENKIAAVSRTEFGKGAARRTRRAGMVPAVLYGHGTDPVHLSLPGHELLLALRVANAVLELSVDGGNDQLALAKQVQRNPVKGNIEHLDLVIVRKGEKVTVEVPLVVVGDHAADGVIVMD
ncbi:50S ribosomal protein L25, partial [Propionicimonas sp.]|uniref:50S ribosomal protein L25 n=1 Tax=Propionicimonas sp. TaxID=1955623 RepID=UPI0039E68D39